MKISSEHADANAELGEVEEGAEMRRCAWNKAKETRELQWRAAVRCARSGGERARRCTQSGGGSVERAGAVHRRRGGSWRRPGMHAIHAAPLA